LTQETLKRLNTALSSSNSDILRVLWNI